MLQTWVQIALTLLIGFLISIPTGRYLASVVTGASSVVDRVFDPLDNCLYALIGRRICTQAMDWKSYTLHMLAANLAMAILIFLILFLRISCRSTRAIRPE
jgi:potassium-transporting ATPase potassium-binding subunit